MSHRLSLSRIGLAHKCAYGFRSDVPVVPRPSGEAAQVGSLVHAMVEARVTGRSMRENVDPTILSKALAIYQGPLSGYIDAGIEARAWTECEKGYRLDAENDICRGGPRRGEPGYEKVEDMTVPGTLDLVGVQGEEATVEDLKTGAPPKDSEQLYGQAVVVSRRHGVKRVRVRYLRALKTKVEHLNEEVLDEDRLDAEAGRIRRLLRVLPTSEPNPGDWCHWCEAWAACPKGGGQRDREYVAPDPPESSLYADDVRLF